MYLQTIRSAAPARVYRVLYHSRSVTGRDIAVSGTIWVPGSLPPPGGYPIVSFGTDNDGSGDICASSTFAPGLTQGQVGCRRIAG